jgi:hypothetical protein
MRVTREKDCVCASHLVCRGCSNLVSIFWVLACGARVVQVFHVAMCPAVDTGTCVWGHESRDTSGGGRCRAIGYTRGGGERGLREGLC